MRLKMEEETESIEEDELDFDETIDLLDLDG